MQSLWPVAQEPCRREHRHKFDLNTVRTLVEKLNPCEITILHSNGVRIASFEFEEHHGSFQKIFVFDRIGEHR